MSDLAETGYSLRSATLLLDVQDVGHCRHPGLGWNGRLQPNTGRSQRRQAAAENGNGWPIMEGTFWTCR